MLFCIAARTSCLVGSSTISKRRMTVNGKMMSPYSCALKLPRNRSAVPQMKLDISDWFILFTTCNVVDEARSDVRAKAHAFQCRLFLCGLFEVLGDAKGYRRLAAVGKMTPLLDLGHAPNHEIGKISFQHASPFAAFIMQYIF